MSEQQANTQVTPLPEAPASANVKVVNLGNQMEWMITIRAHTLAEVLDRIPVVEEWMNKHGYVSFDAYVDRRRSERNGNNGHPPTRPTSAPTKPPVASDNRPTQELTFEAETLTATTKDGKAYWRVKGGKFSKYGVICWPEVLGAVGFFVAELDPMETYDLRGFTAVYVTKEGGKIDKVIRLEKSQ